MWGFVETNDTLQITRQQWFPEMLDYDTHVRKPFLTNDFEWKVFHFHDKKSIRIYQTPPIRNFLVENIDGKWLYWWLIHVLEQHHDMETQTTSWTFKIVHIYSPEEMLYAHRLIDRTPSTDYLNVL